MSIQGLFEHLDHDHTHTIYFDFEKWCARNKHRDTAAVRKLYIEKLFFSHGYAHYNYQGTSHCTHTHSWIDKKWVWKAFISIWYILIGATDIIPLLKSGAPQMRLMLIGRMKRVT